jgi:hypothetical protein
MTTLFSELKPTRKSLRLTFGTQHAGGIWVQLLCPPRCTRSEAGALAADALFMEVDTPATRSAAIGVSSEVISGILNSVCPDCGGRMGAVGKEFKCRGERQTDWRPLWEQLVSAGFHRPSRK